MKHTRKNVNIFIFCIIFFSFHLFAQDNIEIKGEEHQMLPDVERREGLEEQAIDRSMLFEDGLEKKEPVGPPAEYIEEVKKAPKEMISDVELRESGKAELLSSIKEEEKKGMDLEKAAAIAKKILRPKQEMVPDVQRREAGKVKLLKGLAKEKKEVPGMILVPINRKFEYHVLGGVCFENMYDSRQVIGSRYNEFIYAPAPQNLDPNGQDINDKDQFNMMGVRACCSLHVKGPEIWGAQTSAVIEGEFNGLADDTVRLFRLERAHANFDWEHTTLLIGHYYHPLVLDEMFPETISRGHGIVYDPFQYAPQIKLRHRVKNFDFVFALAKDFDRQEARWATVPDIFAQLNLNIWKQILGAGVNYHAVVPRLASEMPPKEVREANSTLVLEKKYKTTAQVGSLYPFVFALLKFDPFQLRLRATYAQNASVYDITGAYAVQYRSPVTDERLYVNLRTVTFWADFIYKRNQRIEPAIFFGVAKNLGAKEKILRGYEYDDNFYSLLTVEDSVTSIDHMLIFAPRVRIRFGNFTIGAEIEYTKAAFAPGTPPAEGWQDDYNCKGAVVCSRPVSNFRFLLATFYDFDYTPFAFK